MIYQVAEYSGTIPFHPGLQLSRYPGGHRKDQRPDANIVQHLLNQ